MKTPKKIIKKQNSFVYSKFILKSLYASNMCKSLAYFFLNHCSIILPCNLEQESRSNKTIHSR